MKKFFDKLCKQTSFMWIKDIKDPYQQKINEIEKFQKVEIGFLCLSGLLERKFFYNSQKETPSLRYSVMPGI